MACGKRTRLCLYLSSSKLLLSFYLYRITQASTAFQWQIARCTGATPSHAFYLALRTHAIVAYLWNWVSVLYYPLTSQGAKPGDETQQIGQEKSDILHLHNQQEIRH